MSKKLASPRDLQPEIGKDVDIKFERSTMEKSAELRNGKDVPNKARFVMGTSTKRTLASSVDPVLPGNFLSTESTVSPVTASRYAGVIPYPDNPRRNHCQNSKGKVKESPHQAKYNCVHFD